MRETAGRAGGEACEAPDLVRGDINFTQAAHAVGVPKRTGKVWRNGRIRSTGRDERLLADWYHGDMD